MAAGQPKKWPQNGASQLAIWATWSEHEMLLLHSPNLLSILSFDRYSVFLSLSLSFSIYIYIHTYIHIFYIYTYIHIYIYIYIYIYVYIYIYRHIYSIYIYIHMSLYLSISPSSVALFTHLYTWIHPFYGYLPRTISGSGRSVPQEALLRETGETERSLVGSSLHGGAKKVGGISPIHKW